MNRSSLSELFTPMISQTDKTPLYEQLYISLRQSILQGQLVTGERLPASRALAQQLGVSRNTVATAYELLLAEGFIATRQGAGTYVAASVAPILSKAEALPALSDTAIPAVSRLGLQLSSYTAVRASGALLAPALPDFSVFPHKVWQRAVSQGSKTERQQEVEMLGSRLLREEVARHLATTRGVQADSDQIMITSGSQQGIAMALQLLLNPGDSVVLEEIGFKGVDKALLLAGAKACLLESDEQGICFDASMPVVQDAKVALVTPSRSFPLGVTLSLPRRMQLLQWASEQERWIIEDDYDSDLIYNGRSLAALQGLDSQARVIYCGTFSRSMYPAIRLGYLVLPRSLTALFCTYRQYAEGGSSQLTAHAMGYFMAQGQYARHLRRIRKRYLTRKNMLVQLMSHYVSHLTPVASIGGLHSVYLNSQLDDVACAEACWQQGIGIRALSDYHRRPLEQLKGLVLGFGATPADKMEQSVARLAAVIACKGADASTIE